MAPTARSSRKVPTAPTRRCNPIWPTAPRLLSRPTTPTMPTAQILERRQWRGVTRRPRSEPSRPTTPTNRRWRSSRLSSSAPSSPRMLMARLAAVHWLRWRHCPVDSHSEHYWASRQSGRSPVGWHWRRSKHSPGRRHWTRFLALTRCLVPRRCLHCEHSVPARRLAVEVAPAARPPPRSSRRRWLGSAPSPWPLRPWLMPSPMPSHPWGRKPWRRYPCQPSSRVRCRVLCPSPSYQLSSGRRILCWRLSLFVLLDTVIGLGLSALGCRRGAVLDRLR